MTHADCNDNSNPDLELQQFVAMNDGQDEPDYSQHEIAEPESAEELQEVRRASERRGHKGWDEQM